MRIKKKTAMIISIAVGSVLFASTALADVMAKSGYDELKDGIKYTTGSLANTLQSCTVDMSIVLKDNGTAISSSEDTIKYDASKNARENTTVKMKGNNEKYSSYYYTDKNCSISYDNNQDVYYENDFSNSNVNNQKIFPDPFKEKEAADIEKIADAVVGNLKDYVVVKQNTDGTKELSGSLSEAQIPALINAVASYEIKKQFGGYRADRVDAVTSSNNSLPRIDEDVFAKEIRGDMTLSKDGLIQTVLATGAISGKDDTGKEHDLSLEVLFKLTDINSTVVNKPDLAGKKVENNVQNNNDVNSNPEIYVGEYKNDIVIEKDGKFQKIGERFVDITRCDSNGISGRYHEEFAKGYEDYAANKKDFNFDAKYSDNDKYNASFSTNISADKTIKGNISTPPRYANIYFSIDGQNQGLMFNDNFARVFD